MITYSTLFQVKLRPRITALAVFGSIWVTYGQDHMPVASLTLKRAGLAGLRAKAGTSFILSVSIFDSPK